MLSFCEFLKSKYIGLVLFRHAVNIQWPVWPGVLKPTETSHAALEANNATNNQPRAFSVRRKLENIFSREVPLRRLASNKSPKGNIHHNPPKVTQSTCTLVN